MEQEKLLLRFFQVVAFGLRHKHYKHTIDKHKTYMQLVAGVGLDELLAQYVRRENADLFAQRKRLTKHVVTAVCKNLMDVFYKVPRSNSARRVLTYTGDAVDKKVREVEGLLTKFWGDESWDDYMATRFVELNSIDPNSFVVFEWDKFDAEVELIQPRPFEVKSSAAIDFKYNNKVLEYLIVMDDYQYKEVAKQGESIEPKLKNPNKNKKKGRKYTLYAQNQTWQLLQVDENEVPLTVNLQEGKPVEATRNGEKVVYVKLAKHYYEFKTFDPHNCEAVPAFRVGYYRDLATDGETFVNPIHAAEPYLMKTIKVNSELDLVATLLAFPQMIKYGLKCEDTKCYQGYYEDNTACKTCGGTGVKPTAPSAQDAIVIPMPESKEELIPLSEIVQYINPPVDIVKWQEDYVEKLTQKAKRIMFNSDTFGPKETAETAHGRNLDMQNVYDTLHPFAVRFGKIWTMGVKTMAKLADRVDNLVASYTFGKDFKLKSLDSLIVDLSIANKIGSPSLVRHLNSDIAQIIFSEKPIELQRYELKELYNPFAGKSEKEVVILMASPYVSKREKVLHANYGKIFDELELEHANSSKDFYKLNRTAQREAVYKKVDEIIGVLDKENPSPSLDLGE